MTGKKKPVAEEKKTRFTQDCCGLRVAGLFLSYDVGDGLPTTIAIRHVRPLWGRGNEVRMLFLVFVLSTKAL
jgi:hypothetical protein